MSISVHLRFPDASLEVCLQQALNWSIWMEYRLPDILIGYFYFNIQNELVDYENLFFWFGVFFWFWGFFLVLKFSVSINEKGLFPQSTRADYVNGSYMCMSNVFVHEGDSLYLDLQS